MTTSLRERTCAAGVVATHRLLVTRRDPSVPQYRPIGFLECHEGGFSFAYFRSVVTQPWFSPLPGLSRTEGAYHSSDLFPLFAERVISPRRADRPHTMRALALGADATPFEVLTRSGGRRVEDSIELTPVPVPDAHGSVVMNFLVHGVRYQTASAQERITSLIQGAPLTIEHEPTNLTNGRAQVVLEDGHRLGYVPDPLVEVVDGMTERQASVLQANGPDVGFHLRLLVRLTGRVKTAPFTGPEWLTV